MRTILIVDDEDISRETLHDLLFTHFKIIMCGDSRYAIDSMIQHKPSLVLLDMQMPKINGIEVCKKIRTLREFRTMPVVMISGISCENTRTSAFLSGVDDFIIKPVAGQELVARILSKLNWQRQLVTQAEQKNVTHGNLLIDERRLSVSVDGKPLRLTNFQFNLLRYFIENCDRVLSRDKILKDVWKSNNVTNRTIDSHVYTLRQKLQKYDYELCTIHGAGYILKPKINAEPTQNAAFKLSHSA